MRLPQHFCRQRCHANSISDAAVLKHLQEAENSDEELQSEIGHAGFWGEGSPSWVKSGVIGHFVAQNLNFYINFTT